MPPPLRAKENWSTGLRFFEQARKSNVVHEIMYPLPRWTRERWSETLEKGVAVLQHIEDNVPVLREALQDTRNDQPFIANSLLTLAPAVDMELNDEYRGFLRSLARRIQQRTESSRSLERASAAPAQLTCRSRFSQNGLRSSRLSTLPAPDKGSALSLISTLRGHL